MVSVETVFDLLFTGEAIAQGVLAAGMYWKLRDHRERALSSFKLHTEASVRDFELLLAMYSVALLGTITHTAGYYLRATGDPRGNVLLLVGFTVVFLAYLPTLWVYYRWYRRF